MTSTMIYAVAVASKIDQTLSYTAEGLEDQGHSLTVGALVVVPLGKRLATGLVVSSSTERSAELNDVRLRSIQTALPRDLWLTEELVDLLTWAARYYHQPLGKVLSTALPGAVLKASSSMLTPRTAWEANSVQPAGQILARAPRQKELYQWVLGHPQSTSISIRDAGFDLNLLRQLKEKNLVDEIILEKKTFPEGSKIARIEDSHLLSNEQSAALKEIVSADYRKPFLLDGVTGSGKTEVYLQAAEQLLNNGKQVLILVPEIGLIHQTEKSFSQRFDAETFVYTSECSESEKLAAWRAACSNKAAIFIGTRSAIFLPLAHLGIILVDEEHDLSFKQQEGFRYHARDLATLRSKKLEAPLVLGSATPSLESYKNVLSKTYRHLCMRSRVAKIELPKISLQLRQQNSVQNLSDESLNKISAVLESGDQVLVFINRRGFAPRLSCNFCGWIALCPQCDTALCKHKQPAHLICHHCDYREVNPSSCPRCDSHQLTSQGFGTEQLEQNLQSWFPNIDCIRIDRDSTSRKGSFKRHIEKANQGKPCILIGTQMLAKGHHLPRLSLAVICEADQALFSHDYRAAEQLGQLITQVAGRTGRNKSGGELIVETSYPDHPLWTKLQKSNYSDYATELMLERKKRHLPPHSYAALLRAESHALPTLINFMDLAKNTNITNSNEIEIIGPMPAPMERRNGRFRYQLSLNSPNRKALHQTLAHLSSSLRNLKGMSQVRWGIDVDPQTMD